MKRLLLGLLAASVLAMPITASAQEKTPAADQLPTVAQITKALDDLYKSKSSEATMTMKVVNDRGTRELTMDSWSKGKELSLVVIRKPSREAGTATLKTDEGLWNYAPRADRLIRIPTGMLSDAWMGSHFSNDDLVRDTSYEEDYDTKLAWAELNGAKVIKVTFTPKPEAPVIYTKIDFYVRATDYVSLQADYFDRGKLIRRMEFSDIKDVGGKEVPHKMVLRPMTDDKKGESTTMTYQSLKFDGNVSDDLFTKRGLRRAAKKK